MYLMPKLPISDLRRSCKDYPKHSGVEVDAPPLDRKRSAVVPVPDEHDLLVVRGIDHLRCPHTMGGVKELLSSALRDIDQLNLLVTHNVLLLS